MSLTFYERRVTKIVTKPLIYRHCQCHFCHCTPRVSSGGTKWLKTTTLPPLRRVAALSQFLRDS
nr:MAG TPA: hypothetical protein [Caudoviricetes sp.]